MGGECDANQQLTKAVIYKPRHRKPNDELAPGCTTQELSAEDVFAVRTTSPFSVAKSMTPSMQVGDTESRGNSTEQYRSVSIATSAFRAVTSVRSQSARYTLPPLTLTKAQAEDEQTLYSPNISSERGFSEKPGTPSHTHYALTTATINTTGAPEQEVSAPYEQEKTESAPDLRTKKGPHVAGITSNDIQPLSNHSAVATIATPKSQESSEQGSGNAVPTTNHEGLELYSTINDISGQPRTNTEPISAATEPQSLSVGFTAASVTFENSTTSTIDAIEKPATTTKMAVPEYNGSQAPLTTHLTRMHHSGSASQSTPSIVPHQTRSAPTTVTSNPHTEANYETEKSSEYMYQTTFRPSEISPSSKRGTETLGSRRATQERNTHRMTTTSDPGTGKRPTVTHVEDTEVIYTTTTEFEWPHYTRYPSRLPHVIFTDFFQKFATTRMPLKPALSEEAKRNSTVQQMLTAQMTSLAAVTNSLD
ncbi:mucin-5AC [Rhipicephalus sanguineus]|uniref:mucin-5AC n=1 Tax=Rhipicephalus sanguineus TaxID=34632 RepID=UPI0020C2BFDD|nr:mucin-5AC [Rhipicephalus sanguineus]